MEERHINFTRPVIAQFVRIIPIQWVGVSICLTMEIYGCTIRGNTTYMIGSQILIYFTIECPSFVTNGDKLLERVTTSLNDERLFDITHYWCTNVTTQNILMNFSELIHLTRLRVRGTSLSFRILVNKNETIYSDINGINVSINIILCTCMLCNLQCRNMMCPSIFQ